MKSKELNFYLKKLEEQFKKTRETRNRKFKNIKLMPTEI